MSIAFVHAVPALLAILLPLTTTDAQQPALRHLRQMMPSDNDRSDAVALADVDQDGDLDAVFGNEIGPDRMYLNDGTGWFREAPPSHLPMDGDSTRAVVFGDVDADGDPDLLMANSGQNRLYLNDGSGRFGDVTSSNLPPGMFNTGALALGDVDGDGDLDAVLGNWRGTSTGQNALWLNDGSGRFTDATTTNMPGDSQFTASLDLGDVDGDGDIDLVIGNASPGVPQNRLYRNNGGGVFSNDPRAMPIDADWTADVELVDVEGDGDPDLLLGNSTRNRLYLNNGAGLFTDYTSLLLPPIVAITASLAVGDVDDDGDADFLAGNIAGAQSGQNRLYLNDGAGWFQDVTGTALPELLDNTRAVTLGDVDGDGDLDALTANNPVNSIHGQNRLNLNDGRGRFQRATAPALPSDSQLTWALAIADVDGDDDPDLLVANAPSFVSAPTPGQNRLYLNDGRGTFTDATARLPSDSEWTMALDVGDVDGDGDNDVLFGNSSNTGSANRLYLNDGQGRFVDVSQTHLPPDISATAAVALGDFDSDGDLDAMVGNRLRQFGSFQNHLYRNGGSGVFTNITAGNLPVDNDSTSAIALGDLDGDGDLDAVLGNDAGTARLYLNDGTARFTDASSRLIGGGARDVRGIALGDVDADGDLDVVFGALLNASLVGQTRLYLNDGRGFFADVTATHLPSDGDDTAAVALADFDGDGDLDLLIANEFYDSSRPLQNRLYVNDGSGVFSDATATSLPDDRDRSGALAVGDLDADGDIDAVVGNLSQRNRVLINLLRQLSWRNLFRVAKPITMEIHAPPGTPLFVVAISLRAGDMTTPYGTLGLASGAGLGFLVGTLDPGGHGTVVCPVPADPSLVGGSLYWQALLATAPFVLTNAERTVLSEF